MNTIDLPLGKIASSTPNFINDNLRVQAIEHAKTFKTSWVSLGQTLYSIWRDKLDRKSTRLNSNH